MPSNELAVAVSHDTLLQLRALLLPFFAAFLLPIAAWQALNACVNARHGNPIQGSVLDAQTQVVDLQDDIPYVGSLSFLLDPYRFLSRCQRALADSAWFRFHFCGRCIVVISDPVAAERIFDSPQFSLMGGHSLMLPHTDGADNLNPCPVPCPTQARYLRYITSTVLLEPVFPGIARDLARAVESLGTQGTMEPDAFLGKLVITSCLRLLVGGDSTSNSQVIESFHRYSLSASQHVAPEAAVMPWFPTPSRLRYIYESIRSRKALTHLIEALPYNIDDEPQSVAQMMLKKHMEPGEIGQIISSILLMASLDTSKSVFWLFTYLVQHPVWLAKVETEVAHFIAARGRSRCQSLEDTLNEVMLRDWENADNFPVLDMCFREVLRLVVNGTLPRRNTGGSVIINGRTIRRGEYCLVLTENLHFDPEIYSEPLRFVPDRELSTTTSPEVFVGWGRGVHACMGRRFAQVLVRAIVVVVLGQLSLDLEPSDSRMPGIVPGILRTLSSSSVADPDETIRFAYMRRG